VLQDTTVTHPESIEQVLALDSEARVTARAVVSGRSLSLRS
jgi:hypothetical protein